MGKELVVLFTLHVVSLVAGQVPCTDFAVRLAPTPSLLVANTGRLEICKGGVWGTIEGPRFWSRKNVQVACQQMGFAGALNAIPTIGLLIDQSSAPSSVHYGNVRCNGQEANFSQCELSPVSQPDHTMDVYIACLPNQEPYSTLHTLAAGSFAAGDFRLVGNAENGRGAVEIFTSQGLSTICPDSNWNSEVAQLLCEGLGYESGAVENFELDPGTVASRSVSGIECARTGGAFRVQAGRCSFLSDPSCPVRDNLFAGISCSSSSAEQSVRLFGMVEEDDRVRGTVEILFDGRWGLLCRPSVAEVASPVCEGLGYSRENSILMATPNAEIYRLTESRLKPIWVPSLTCASDANSLSDCTLNSPIGYGNCLNGNLLLVDCRNPPYMLPPYGIALIVLSCVAVVGFLIWYLVHGKQCWANRKSSQWYRNWSRRLGRVSSCCSSFGSNLKDCCEFCGSCCNNCSCCRPTPQTREVAPSHPRPVEQQPQPIPAPAAAPPTAPPTASTTTSHPPEPSAPELTKVAPPDYEAASGLPGRNEEYPPPYPGLPGPGPAAAFPPMPPPPGEVYPPNAAYPPPS